MGYLFIRLSIMYAMKQINRTLRRCSYSFIKLDKKQESASFMITKQICNYSGSSYLKSQNHSLICYGIPTSRFIHTNKVNNEREHVLKSESASYEGSGKTTVTILNEEVKFIMIDSVGLSGFRLNTGLKGNMHFNLSYFPYGTHDLNPYLEAPKPYIFFVISSLWPDGSVSKCCVELENHGLFRSQ